MKNLVKKFISKLPLTTQQDMKRFHFRKKCRSGRFNTYEPEFYKLHEYVKEGDWVMDIGANVGCYTFELSRLVGCSGRVFSFEPVPETFELLSGNARLAPNTNISLFNLAASDEVCIVHIAIPSFNTGLSNFYMANVQKDTSNEDGLNVLAMPIDNLGLSERVSLIKLDVEKHELLALRGMVNLLKRDKPLLIVEDTVAEVDQFLAGLGYSPERNEGSPNKVYTYRST